MRVPAGWPRRRTCWTGAWSRWCWRRGRRRGRRCGSGTTCGCSPAGGSWSTRRRRSCWPRPAGRRRTRTGTRPARSGPSEYLQPLADALGDRVRYGARVVGVARRGRDRVVDAGPGHRAADRARRRPPPGRSGSPRGRWWTPRAPGGWPNPLGADGLPALGERAAADRIAYRVPDLDDPAVAARYAGRRVAVAGAGHSALTALVAFAELAERYPGHARGVAAAPGRRSATPSAAVTPTSCRRAARSGSGRPGR